MKTRPLWCENNQTRPITEREIDYLDSAIDAFGLGTKGSNRAVRNLRLCIRLNRFRYCDHVFPRIILGIVRTLRHTMEYAESPLSMLAEERDGIPARIRYAERRIKDLTSSIKKHKSTLRSLIKRQEWFKAEQ